MKLDTKQQCTWLSVNIVTFMQSNAITQLYTSKKFRFKYIANYQSKILYTIVSKLIT